MVSDTVDERNAFASPSRLTGKIPLFFALAAALFGAFAFQLWFHAVRTSATIDEGAHILAGHRHWQCGDFGINPEHPPMLKLLAAAPLEFQNWQEPNWECGSRLTPKPEMFSAGTSFMVRNGIDPVVVRTRLAAAVMSLFLAVLVFLAAWEMFGRAEALTALALLAFEPNLIAHGSIVTTDMAISATALAVFYALYRYGKRPVWSRFLTAGLMFGLLLAAKHSAVLLVPVMLAVLIADRLFFGREEVSRSRSIARQTAAFAGMFLIGFIVLWAFYGFRYYSIPAATADTISVKDYIKENGRPEMVESFSAKTTGFISRLHVFPESYVLGMADVIAWGSRNTWIFGKNYATGQWYYFPLALLVKSSVALLVLLPLGLVFPFFYPERRREMMFLLAPALCYLAVAMTSSFTTGVRHALPVYAFFIIAAGAGAVRLARKVKIFGFILAALLVFHAVAAFRTAPDYLAFANDFWGGTDNTHRIFSDSNLDTGQNLKLVKEYLARENVADCWFAAFNHRELVEAMQPCRTLPSAMRILVSPTVIEPVPPVIEGTVLISANELPPRGWLEYVPITQQGAPVAFIGGNTLVYRGRFEIPLAAAMSHAYRSGQFLRIDRLEEALAEGRRAVELGGDDPRTHLALGLALVRAGQKDEARKVLATAAELSKTSPFFRNAEVRAQLELERLK